MSYLACLVGPAGTWRPRAFSAAQQLGYDSRVFAGEGAALGSLGIIRPALVVVLADVARRDILLFAAALAASEWDIRLLVVARAGWDGIAPQGLSTLGATVLSETASVADYQRLFEASAPLRKEPPGNPHVSLFDRSGRQEAELVELEPDRAQLRTRAKPLTEGAPVRFRLRSDGLTPEIRCLGEVMQTVLEDGRPLSDVRISAISPDDAAGMLRGRLKGH